MCTLSCILCSDPSFNRASGITESESKTPTGVFAAGTGEGEAANFFLEEVLDNPLFRAVKDPFFALFTKQC